MNQNLKKIREACIKANPEIVNKDFGCRFKIISKDGFHFAHLNKFGTDIFFYDGTYKLLCQQGWISMDEYVNNQSKWEIIGREIGIADVLLAIGNSEKWEQGWFVTYTGKFAKIEEIGGGDKFANVFLNRPPWNLLKPLEGQTEEVWEFIANLL